MIKLNINHSKITASDLEPLIVGSVNSSFLKFIFSPEWNNLARIAVFRNGDAKISVSIESDERAIPWEVLTAPGELFVSLRGLGNSGNYVLCTENEFLGKVKYSDASTTAVSAEDATPEVLDTLLADVAEIKANEGGCGESGSTGCTQFNWCGTYDNATFYGLNDIVEYNGSCWIYTDSQSSIGLFPCADHQWELVVQKGADGCNGIDGADGQDGYTPVKGLDYFTVADKNELVGLILAALPDGDEVSY